MLYDLVVPRWGKCVAGQMLRLLHTAADPAVALIDLRESVWVEPVGLVGIAAFAEAAAAAGRTPRLIGPKHLNYANYLTRMHLGVVMEALGGEHDLNPVREREMDDLLVLQRFDGSEGADALARLAWERTAGVEAVANALYQAIVEVGANVPEHSGCTGGYAAAASTYDGRRFQFAVGDAGHGLHATLAPVGSAHHADALEMVLERGMTRTGPSGVGRPPGGIQTTRNLVTGLHGEVHAVTGTAARTSWAGGSSTSSGVRPFVGTLLQGTLARP